MDLSDEELEALGMLKERLILPPVIALLRLQGTYTLDIVGCDRQVGYTLLWKQLDRYNKLIGYHSRSL